MLRAAEWAQSTRNQRSYIIDKWVRPYIGKVRLRDLGHERLTRWQADIRMANCPPHQRNQVLRVLSASLGYAVQFGRLPSNPVAHVARSKHRVTRPQALTAIEVERIRANMPTPRDAAMVTVMAYTGLRPSELAALTWGDVAANLVTVERAFTAGELKATKTDVPRDVDLIAEVRTDLDAIRPVNAVAGELVFPNEAGGYINFNNWRAREWARAAIAAGFTRTRTNRAGREVVAASISPYDLRHTFASLSIHAGETILEVAAAMGHTTGKLVHERYGHVYKSARNAPRVSVADAAALARAELHAQGVRSVCDPPELSVVLGDKQRGKIA